ncbi:MAG TPA: lytic transglycosylase domain-containing protein [Xanthobacteraceae bacterium]|nr:lytic transglycosylase domain-containing protein [Xanthobacteraceae bacterium]
MPVTAIRLILVLTAIGLLAGQARAAPVSGEVPLPRPRPALKSDSAAAKIAAHGPAAQRATAPMSLAPSSEVFATSAVQAPGLTRYDAPRGSSSTTPSRSTTASAQSTPQLAVAASAYTSPLDLAAVKKSIELTRKGRPDEATAAADTIADPLARKLAEWAILRSDEADLDFPRYAAFIAANPSWPGINSLRRRAEAALWQQPADPRSVIEFFRTAAPYTAKGRFALARAFLAQGNSAGAQALVREAWRKDGFSADVETQARAAFAGLIDAADDKVRMNARFDVEDDDAGMRAAQQLGGAELAIAKARAAVINKSAKAKALLEAVPAADRHDPGYMLSRVQWLRRSDKMAEAAQWMLAAPREAERLGDLDQWWVERRLIARKLLDLGEAKAAYQIASDAATPVNENYRSDQQFTAGWIALRFLREPTAALAHFARIADGVVNPITLARSYYWQGRAAEALGRGQEARAFYETAARYPTAYYGQLARARLGIEAVTLRDVPEPGAEYRRLEVARAFEILYAIDERDLAAVMAAEFADQVRDVAALTAIAEIAARHNDARATLLIGKPALGHGLPLEYYAFPDFGVPDYQQIGPEVERCVVYSIVRQESAFNAKVVSSANAIGLMQVTPQTGRDTAKRFNVSFDQHRLMADVAYNAQLGTAELGNDIAGWRGSYILAFVAYNAGPRRAREWIEQYGDPRNPKVDPVDWIERIPISETRNYVQRVIENMQIYRARLGNDPRLLIEADLHRGG